MILALRSGLDSVVDAYESLGPREQRPAAGAGPYYTGLFSPADADCAYNYEMCLDAGRLSATRLEISYLVTRHPAARLVGACGVEAYRGAWEGGVFIGASAGLVGLGGVDVDRILGETTRIRVELGEGAYLVQVPGRSGFHHSVLRSCPAEQIRPQHLLPRP